MSFRNAFGIYHVLERRLKSSKTPLTCVELYDYEDVRKYADDINRVSDYLGHMYRRGLLSRVHSKGVGSARWAYSWKDPEVGAPVNRKMQPKLSVVNLRDIETRSTLDGESVVIVDRPSVRISEHGNDLIVETLHFTLTLTPK